MPAIQPSCHDIVKNLDLSLAQLQEIAGHLTSRITEGLQADGKEIGCLPTYLELPSGKQRGDALVVDTGGTNTRAALVSLAPADGEVLEGPNSRKVPDGREGAALGAEEFFATQAKMADTFPKTDERLPLGYCFSYPAQATPDGDAILLRWTKGLKIDGVIGNKVGKALKSALEKEGFSVGDLRVLNDTVASLMGGVHLYSAPRYVKNYVGLIMGTGTNMAGVFHQDQLTKVRPDAFGPSKVMVVNLESGNFHPPHLTEFDDQVDEQSNNPGTQRFEKAVSGHYLAYLLNAIHPGVVDPTKQGAERLVELRDKDQGEVAETAGHLLRRSARLAAAAMAGLVALYPPGETAVLGEGSLFWGDPKYIDTFQDTLKELMPDRTVTVLKQRSDVNLLGAASAALPVATPAVS